MHLGDTDDNSPKWIVGGIDLTSVLRDYRLKSIEGAQMRKHLSDSRVLSLSYVFLLSQTDRCLLTTMSPTIKAIIIKDLNIKKNFKRVESDVVSACREMQLIVEDEEKTDEEKDEELLLIRSQSNNNDVKIAVRIVSGLLRRLTTYKIPGNRKEGEAAQIIEAIRPVLDNFLLSHLKDVKY
ncbi:unnamed protein product [Mucor hiemalis]